MLGGEDRIVLRCQKKFAGSGKPTLAAALFLSFICVPFDDRCAEYYGFIRADLRVSRKPHRA
jgi:hypothetical protein